MNMGVYRRIELALHPAGYGKSICHTILTESAAHMGIFYHIGCCSTRQKICVEGYLMCVRA